MTNIADMNRADLITHLLNTGPVRGNPELMAAARVHLEGKRTDELRQWAEDEAHHRREESERHEEQMWAGEDALLAGEHARDQQEADHWRKMEGLADLVGDWLAEDEEARAEFDPEVYTPEVLELCRAVEVHNPDQPLNPDSQVHVISRILWDRWHDDRNEPAELW